MTTPGNPTPCLGLRIEITGKVRDMKRGEVQDYLKKTGARTDGAVDQSTALLLLGDTYSQNTTKHKQAVANQTPVVDFRTFQYWVENNDTAAILKACKGGTIPALSTPAPKPETRKGANPRTNRLRAMKDLPKVSGGMVGF